MEDIQEDGVKGENGAYLLTKKSLLHAVAASCGCFSLWQPL